MVVAREVHLKERAMGVVADYPSGGGGGPRCPEKQRGPLGHLSPLEGFKIFQSGEKKMKISLLFRIFQIFTSKKFPLRYCEVVSENSKKAKICDIMRYYVIVRWCAIYMSIRYSVI